MEQELTQRELDERIAILKKFRSLLEKQRERFSEYLKVLELQEKDINLQDAEAIFAHSELENQIVSNISSLQKVIAPMESLYKAASYNVAETVPVSMIQKDLEKLKTQVLLQNQKNQELLRISIKEVKHQLDSMHNPYKNNRSIYAERKVSGSMLTIDA